MHYPGGKSRLRVLISRASTPVKARRGTLFHINLSPANVKVSEPRTVGGGPTTRFRVGHLVRP